MTVAISKLRTYGGPGGIGGPWSRPLIKQCRFPQTFARKAVWAKAFALKLTWPQTFNLKANVRTEI